MKKILAITLSILTSLCLAQTKIEKTISVSKGNKLILIFDYPELIKVKTWDKPEVLITGSVSINRGENDNAFDLQVSNTGKETTITSIIKDKDNLPQRIVIKKDDQEFYFKSASWNDPEVQKFLEEHGRQYTYMSNGVIKEIELEVFVPKGMETRIEAKYGMVEVKDFQAPLVVNSKYGGIDATIARAGIGQLTARTRYGEILSNLDIQFKSEWDNVSKDKWTEISANLGSGPQFSLESKYGKVYLRKPN